MIILLYLNKTSIKGNMRTISLNLSTIDIFFITPLLFKLTNIIEILSF